MRWWPRKPAPPDATPFIEEDPALETSPRTTKCARPDCFNDIPPDRDRFCSDECLKAYSVSVMGKIRGLRTLRGYTYQASRSRRRAERRDRKSTRLNSSHGYISYAVFCLKKKKT